MKELTDVTLEDVVRYKGSRWKAKLKAAEVNLPEFISQLSTFLNDIPECRKLRAYTILGDGDLAIDTSRSDYSNIFYEYYMKIHKVLDSLKVDDGLDFPVFADFKSKSVMINTSNPEWSRVNEIVSVNQRNYTSKQDDCDYNNRQIDDAYENFRRSEETLSAAVIALDESTERLEKIEEHIEIDVGQVLTGLDSSLRANGFIPIAHRGNDRGRVEILFSVYPRLMYDVSVNRKPLTTMPFLMQLSYESNHIGLSLFKAIAKAGTYNAPHPHVASGVCWGSDLGRTVREAAVVGDYGKVIESLNKLTRSYHSGSPYITYGGYLRKLNYSSLCKYKSESSTLKLTRFINRFMDSIDDHDWKFMRAVKTTDLLGTDILNDKTPEGVVQAIDLLDTKIKEKHSEQTSSEREEQEEEGIETAINEAVDEAIYESIVSQGPPTIPEFGTLTVGRGDLAVSTIGSQISTLFGR